MNPPCPFCPVPEALPCPHRLAPLGCPAVLAPTTRRRLRILAPLARMVSRSSAAPTTIIAAIVTCPHRDCDCNSARAPFAICSRDHLPMPTDFELCEGCVANSEQSRSGMTARLQAPPARVE